MTVSPNIVILAASRGRKMFSCRAKVLHSVLFRPMLHYPLDLAAALPRQSLSVVVGQDAEEIKSLCGGYEGLRFFEQEAELGSAHAVRILEPFLRGQAGSVLILSGDAVLLGLNSLKKLLERHEREGAVCTLGTTILAQPNGYGRVLRRVDGSIAAIREEPDCTPTEKIVNEVNAGIYCFQIPALFSALARVTNINAKNEFYLPDVVQILAAEGGKVVPYAFGDPMEAMGIEDCYALHKVEAVLQEKINRELMRQGVTLQDPRTTMIDPRCRIASDVRIEGGCTLVNSIIEADVVIESQSRIVDSMVGAATLVKQGSYIEKSLIGAACAVGPYAHLRPGTRLGGKVKIGNFVEVKNSEIGANSKASHLSYIGDAEIGRGVNIGCGFITCNFDGGPEKRKTVIEDDVFIGSDCQTVAPVRIGRGSYLAAGTTATEDVPPESLAISRGRQTTKAGYAKKYRAPKAKPLAAESPRGTP